MKGLITAQQRFLFPDTPLEEMPSSLRVVSAENGKVGIQLMFECAQAAGGVRVCGEGFDAEIYRMIDIPVEYNTGDGVNQGGAMVVLCEECPDYAVRKAPFRVYDCLEPVQDGRIEAKNGRACAYVCLSPMKDTPAGKHEICLECSAGEEKHLCRIEYSIYPVSYD